MTEEIVARCVCCRSEFTEEQTKGHKACPACGEKGLPMHPKDDVNININWHELRILFIWAEFWANHCMKNKDMSTDMIKVVHSIADYIQQQHPSKSMPLTVGGEIRQMRQMGLDVESDVQEGPTPPLLN